MQPSGRFIKDIDTPDVYKRQGYGREMAELFDLSILGGISVKGTTLEPRLGNKPPRIAETPSGMLNSVGLQNPGIEMVIKKELPFLSQFDTAVILNIAGHSIEEYGLIAERLDEVQMCIRDRDNMYFFTDAAHLNIKTRERWQILPGGSIFHQFNIRAIIILQDIQGSQSLFGKLYRTPLRKTGANCSSTIAISCKIWCNTPFQNRITIKAVSYTQDVYKRQASPRPNNRSQTDRGGAAPGARSQRKCGYSGQAGVFHTAAWRPGRPQIRTVPGQSWR